MKIGHLSKDMKMKLCALAVAGVLLILLCICGLFQSRVVRQESLDSLMPANEEIPELEAGLDLEYTERYYDTEVNDAGEINYSYLQKRSLENSKLPRIDITLAPDYLLTRSYSDCYVSVSNTASNYLFNNAGAQIRVRGISPQHLRKSPLN